MFIGARNRDGITHGPTLKVRQAQKQTTGLHVTDLYCLYKHNTYHGLEHVPKSGGGKGQERLSGVGNG